ncbi:MAG: hypothetical protein ACRCZI_12090 [Cetobacterium sp.]
MTPKHLKRKFKTKVVTSGKVITKNLTPSPSDNKDANNILLKTLELSNKVSKEMEFFKNNIFKSCNITQFNLLKVIITNYAMKCVESNNSNNSLVHVLEQKLSERDKKISEQSVIIADQEKKIANLQNTLIKYNECIDKQQSKIVELKDSIEEKYFEQKNIELKNLSVIHNYTLSNYRTQLYVDNLYDVIYKMAEQTIVITASELVLFLTGEQPLPETFSNRFILGDNLLSVRFENLKLKHDNNIIDKETFKYFANSVIDKRNNTVAHYPTLTKLKEAISFNLALFDQFRLLHERYSIEYFLLVNSEQILKTFRIG